MSQDSNSDLELKDNRNFRPVPPGIREKFGKAMGENAGVFVIKPYVICTDEELRPGQELSLLINNEPAEAISRRFDDAIGQLFYRAYSGDEKAAQLLISKFGNALKSLRKLVDDQRAMMRSIAERSARWPVLLSPNPRDILGAKKRLTELKVGSRTTPPPAPVDKTIPDDFWMGLARNAYNVCELNRHTMTVFLTWTKGSHVKKRSMNYWERKSETTFYHLPNGCDVIAISDWQLQCADLPADIDSASFGGWWDVMVGCVFEHWRDHPDEYAKALKNAAKASNTEFMRRKLALKKLAGAFKRTVGLQKAKVTARI